MVFIFEKKMKKDLTDLNEIIKLKEDDKSLSFKERGIFRWNDEDMEQPDYTNIKTISALCNI